MINHIRQPEPVPSGITEHQNTFRHRMFDVIENGVVGGAHMAGLTVNLGAKATYALAKGILGK